MTKPVPVLQINNFQQPATSHLHFYVQLFQAHIAQYQFVKTPHRHDFYCIFLFTQGKGIHTIDFIDYEVKPGSVFFMLPAQVHTWELSADTDGYVIFFDPVFYLLEHNHKNLADFPFFHSTATPYIYLTNPEQEPITDIFIDTYEQFTGKEYRKEEILRSYLNILLIKLYNIYSQANLPAFSSHLIQQIRQLEALIEKHFLAHKSIHEYAGLMNISVKQLYNICQITLHKSLSSILQERLLLEAKRLLVHTDFTVSQIASQLNYMDNSYFNRFFKKLTGLTPEQFRHQYR